MSKIGIMRSVSMTGFSFAALPQLIAGTELLATMHRRLASKAIGQLPLKMLELPFALPRMAQAAHWHRYRSSDPAMLWLRQALRQSAEGR